MHAGLLFSCLLQHSTCNTVLYYYYEVSSELKSNLTLYDYHVFRTSDCKGYIYITELTTQSKRLYSTELTTQSKRLYSTELTTQSKRLYSTELTTQSKVNHQERICMHESQQKR